MEEGKLFSMLGLIAGSEIQRPNLPHALTRDIWLRPAKSEIVIQGDLSDHVHLIVDGWAVRYRSLPNGSRQITGILLPGDLCDLGAGLSGRALNSVSTLTACQVARVGTAELHRLLESQTDIAKALWAATMRDEAILQTWLLNIGRREALGRIAHLLCELFTRAELIGLTDGKRIVLPLGQQDIADATGLTSVHVNRTLKRLRHEKLISLSGRVLTIENAQTLQRLGGFDPDYLLAQRPPT